jgi:hypothetical protein
MVVSFTIGRARSSVARGANGTGRRPDALNELHENASRSKGSQATMRASPRDAAPLRACTDVLGWKRLLHALVAAPCA